MAKYYYLISGFPDLDIDQAKMPVELTDFKAFLQENLTEKDYNELALLLLQYDNENLWNRLENNDKPFNELALLSAEELEEIVNTRETEPGENPADFREFLRNFAIHYKNDIPVNENLRWADQLTSYYYDFVWQQASNEFLRAWFEFNLNVKNFDAAFIARKYQLDQETEIIGDNDVTSAIINIKAKDCGLSQEYPFVSTIVNMHENENLFDREKQLDKLRWNNLDELTTFEHFTEAQVFAYFIKMQILERWTHLTEERGEAAFNQIFSELHSNYEFPKVFT